MRSRRLGIGGRELAIPDASIREGCWLAYAEDDVDCEMIAAVHRQTAVLNAEVAN